MFRESTPTKPVADGIVKRIEKLVKGQYKEWSIGITDHPKKSKRYHEHPITWWQWNLPDESKAVKIQKYFTGKGMKNAENHQETAKYLYIF